MTLPLQIVAPVLLAAVLHATWNAVIKAGEDRVLTMALVIGIGAALALPVLPFATAPVLARGTAPRLARPGALAPYARVHWKPALGGGLIGVLAYGLVIWALSLGAMVYVSALRETSVVFAVLIGGILLGEPFGRRRIAAALLVALGIAIMHLAG
jgi:drug/metabolite transporter (DMT)-like permease